MPELPEVETVKRIIEPLILNKTIEHVDIFFDRLVLSDLEEFKSKLKNQTITKIERYGKYMFFMLTNDLVLISHLRMEGKWRFNPNGAIRNKFTTAMFNFKDGSALAFDDTRKFGIMYLSNINEYKNLPMISKLGLEPFLVNDENIDDIAAKFNSRKCIKELLLDQSILCGIGNIYADEIAYASNLSPFRKGNTLSKNDVRNICENAKIILTKAIECGGSTIHSFHPSEGVDGRMQVNLLCYGHEGDKCPSCGTYFKKTFIGGRGTTYCPNCQIDSTIKKAIGITGPIGSGKTASLKYFKNKGFFTVSCDDEIHNLYHIPWIKEKISKIIQAPFDIDNENLRINMKKILINQPDKKLAVERFIYPILEEELIKKINENEKIAIEVPLLFKAHFEYMFKKILVLSITEEQQIKYLMKRGDNIDLSKKINSDFSYDKNNKDIVIIDNNGEKEKLIQNLDELYNQGIFD